VAAPITFEDFYAAELGWARRLAYVLTGDGTATDDIVQEALARLYKHYERLDAPRA
jgi:DNA-directed RNA polymerase specialized sigma24 family protein